MTRYVVSTIQACLYFWCLGIYLPEPKHALVPPFHSFLFFFLYCRTTKELSKLYPGKTHCRKWYLPFDL